MNSYNLPNKLKNIIASEKTDFIVKSSKQKSLNQTIPALIFAILFIGVLGFIIFKIVNPILEKNLLDTTKLSEIDNWSTLMIPAIALGIFSVIAIGLLIKTIKTIFDKGAYFVGTEDRLIIYKNNTITSINWNAFSGKTTTKQKHNQGSLILELKTKKATEIIVDEDIYEDNVDEGFVTETIEMIGIRNVITIENKCLYRIKENA